MLERFCQFIRRPSVRTTLVFCFILFTLIAIEARPAFPDPDSFYHAKIAIAIRDQGFIHEFPWLPYTSLGDVYVDHHLLYHVILIPFVTFFDPLVGMKISAVCFGMLAFAAIWRWLKYLETPFPEFLTLAAALSTGIINRIAYPRAISLSIVFFLLGTWAIIERKRFWIFTVAFLYVWLYNGWPVIFMAFGAVVAADAVSRKLTGSATRMTAVVRQTVTAYLPTVPPFLGGLAAGLILNPYFPENLPFSSFLIFKIGLGSVRNFITVGSEWYPVSPEGFFIMNLFILLPFLLCVLLFIPQMMTKPLIPVRERLVPLFTWLLLSAVFIPLTMRSAHFLEYSSPSLILSTGALLVYVWPFIRTDIFPGLRRAFWSTRIRKVASAALLILVIGVRTFTSATLLPTTQFHTEQYAFATDWLKQHADPGDIVFHNIYDFSMVLYYLDDHRRYILGLDPLFMYDRFPETYMAWAGISEGTRPVSDIVSIFNARYVIVETRYNAKDARALLHHMDASPLFTLIGQREDVYLYACTAACDAIRAPSPSSQPATNPSSSENILVF